MKMRQISWYQRAHCLSCVCVYVCGWGWEEWVGRTNTCKILRHNWLRTVTFNNASEASGIHLCYQLIHPLIHSIDNYETPTLCQHWASLKSMVAALREGSSGSCQWEGYLSRKLQFSWVNVKVELLIKSIWSTGKEVTLSAWDVEEVFSEVLTLSWVMNKWVGGSQGKDGGVPGKRTATEKAWCQKMSVVSGMLII